MTAPESGVCWARVELRVASARRQIDNQAIKGSPIDFPQHLNERSHDHGTPPDNGSFLVDEKPHRHCLQAKALQWRHGLRARRREPRFLRQPQELRQRWAVDVGVENSDPERIGLKSEREVDRGRRFANPALAGRNGEDVADARNFRSPLRLAERACARLRWGRSFGGEGHHHLADLR